MIRRIQRLASEYSPRRWLTNWAQRARRGYSTEDTYDFDGYLACVIAGGVQEIRDNLHGWPMQLSEATDSDADALAAWGAILDKIVAGFSLYAEEGGYPLEDTAEAREKTEVIGEARALFNEWYGHLWD
jgi:hypothetical protein